jgi:putative transcriptional regulator
VLLGTVYNKCNKTLYEVLYALTKFTTLLKTVTEPLEISDLVREVRSRLGLTQEELASCLGITFVTVNRWENRHSRPSKMAMKLLEGKVRELGDSGQDLLNQYFSS